MVDQSIGMGACLRNATGQFLGVILDVCSAVMIATKAECWRLNSTLEWLDKLEHHNVILEMDCRLVLDDVNKNKLNLS